MQRRWCPGCGGELPYGAPRGRRYHTVACRRRDTALDRMARERGLAPAILLTSLLNEAGSIVGAATRLGVDHHTVIRWIRRHGIRQRWGDGVVFVVLRPGRRRMRARPEGQRTLL